MRIFNLFLRRAGVTRTAISSRRYASSRLTVVCTREMLSVLRKQIYTDFGAAGLHVLQLQVDQDGNSNLALASITVKCSAEMRTILMTKARQLKAHPDICHVHFEHGRPLVSEALTRL